MCFVEWLKLPDANNEDELQNFNKEYYQKYNLERKNEEVYGELYLKDLEIEEKIQIE